MYFYQITMYGCNFIPPYKFSSDLKKIEKMWREDNERLINSRTGFVSPIQKGLFPKGGNFPSKLTYNYEKGTTNTSTTFLSRCWSFIKGTFITKG